jgi:hypothetical protein
MNIAIIVTESYSRLLKVSILETKEGWARGRGPEID